ncbi:MAG: adenylate/guanylate cyclase domain-containing protein [Alphaproteobacteria bacterium]|nr:adenylate/guanylate cyclase domain-containing protein [Alphaproteobacteria bacterium]
MDTLAPSPPPGRAHERERVWALADWLIRDGRFLPSNNELFTGFCERMAAAGIPIGRVSLHLRALHPQYRGVSRIWRPGEPLSERFLDHGIEKTAMYIESPVHAVAEAGKRLEWRLDGNRPLPYETLEELREEGYVHYVISPFAFEGLVNAISWATKQPGGFTPDDLQFLKDLLPYLNVVAETKALHRFIGHMLTTYIGNEPGRLILEGQVRRGDVMTITAALMLIDLRDFTLLSDTMNPRAVIRLLNDYFDDVIPPIREHGGEVMEIMGDGVLAIFRRGPAANAAESSKAALAAATRGLAAVANRNRRNGNGDPDLRIGIALHYGTVSYGNIGTDDRLDFTVIGPDVNLTSRIERLCRELDRVLIMSEAFAKNLDRPVWEIGAFELRGFHKMQRLFELPPDEMNER